MANVYAAGVPRYAPPWTLALHETAGFRLASPIGSATSTPTFDPMRYTNAPSGPLWLVTLALLFSGFHHAEAA